MLTLDQARRRLTREHIRSYIIERPLPYQHKAKSIDVVSVYGSGNCSTMVGNAVIDISRKMAAKILSDNRRSPDATVERMPLNHGTYCSCK